MQAFEEEDANGCNSTFSPPLVQHIFSVSMSAGDIAHVEQETPAKVPRDCNDQKQWENSLAQQPLARICPRKHLDRNVIVSCINFSPTSAAQEYRTLCQTSVSLGTHLNVSAFASFTTWNQQCQPFAAGDAAVSRPASCTGLSILVWSVMPSHCQNTARKKPSSFHSSPSSFCYICCCLAFS